MLERVAAAFAVSATVASPSFAANQYNAKSVHRVTELLTYTYDATILFKWTICQRSLDAGMICLSSQVMPAWTRGIKSSAGFYSPTALRRP